MLLSSTILAAILVSLASASGAKPKSPAFHEPTSCAAFLPQEVKKAGQADTQSCGINVCPASTDLNNGFHYICGSYTFNQAQAVCAEQGWRLALVEDSNFSDAADTVDACMLDNQYEVWIAAYNGLPGDPCATLINYGDLEMGAFLNIGTQLCSEKSLGVLCQDIPESAVTITTTVKSTTIQSGVTTTTICTACGKKEVPKPRRCQWNCPAWDKSCIPCGAVKPGKAGKKDKTPAQKKAAKDALLKAAAHIGKEDKCLGQNCAPLCSAKTKQIRVLQKKITPANYGLECGKYGWYPLDFTDGRQEEVSFLFESCFPADSQAGWANSYNGIGADCVWLEYNDKYNLSPAGFPVRPEWCTVDNEYYVFCQTSEPYQTGLGVDSGILDITSVTTSVTYSTTIPSKTVTITKTIYQGDSSSH